MASSKTAKPSDKLSNHSAASLQFSLPQMLDLALGTPEVGAVNLNILHNFLHVLLHQVNLRSTKVEYRGEDASRLQNVAMAARTGPSLHLHEYNIIESSGRIKQRIHSTDDVTVKVDVYTEDPKNPQTKNSKGSKPAASAPASARGKGIKEQGSELSLEGKVSSSTTAGAKKSKGSKHQVSAGGVESEVHSVIFVEPIIDGIVPSALGFKQLEDTIHKLQSDFRALEELANTPEMIERIKTNSTDPVTDMWHIINITKRLDAAEKGIDKITAMVQDLIKSDKVLSIVTDGNKKIDGQFPEGDVVQKLTEIEIRLRDLEKQISTGIPPSSGSVEDNPYSVVDPTPKTPTNKNESSAPGGSDSNSDIIALKMEMEQVRKEIIDLTEKIGRTDQLSSSKKKPLTDDFEGSEVSEKGIKVPELKKIDAIVEENSKIVQQMQEMESTFGNTSQELLQRIQELEKDVGCLIEKFNSAPMAGVNPEGSQGLGDLLNKIQGIQSDMENMNQTANKLLDDKETRETHTNALLEQIELLKTIKADKEDLEGALADKADARAVNRKVSYDQFDAACDDLSKGLEDAVSKLSQQEGIWQRALDEVQHEIEGKLDKIEISPLKEFVNNKLKNLQEKLKTLSEMRRESEAAGTKKLLRDVQCLSCDKNVVMKMQEAASYHAESMPCTRSMKPYLTYELDQVRKQQRRLPHGRNMIGFEAAMQEETKRSKGTYKEAADHSYPAKSPRDHLCNRYCGGSHTVTTPQQRVMRMGHFLSQWGPEAIQLTEGVIKGTDGQMYRSRAVPISPEPCVTQEAGDHQQDVNTSVPPMNQQEHRSNSVMSSRGGDPRESVQRSNSNLKPSSSGSQRKTSARRLTLTKSPMEQRSVPVSTPVPKVSLQEVIIEESVNPMKEGNERVDEEVEVLENSETLNEILDDKEYEKNNIVQDIKTEQSEERNEEPTELSTVDELQYETETDLETEAEDENNV